MTDWKVVQGSQPNKPDEFDVTSSPTTIYQRRNIQRITIEDKNENNNDSNIELWQYEERELTIEEYNKLNIQLKQTVEQNRADIDFLAAMTGIDLE